MKLSKQAVSLIFRCYYGRIRTDATLQVAERSLERAMEKKLEASRLLVYYPRTTHLGSETVDLQRKHPDS